jgi:NADPH-dependent ferric siderophore reductase
MIRVVLDGPDLVGLPLGDYTDAYVKLAFPPDGAPYATADEFSELREGLDPRHRPTLRTYTVRAYDKTTAELTLDFVYHGEEGLAGPWAAAARPGDQVILLGPGGGYAPDPAADWHLLVGDESALPAIAAALERIRDGVPVHAFVEVASAAEEQPLMPPADLHLTWVHRDTVGGARGDALVDAVRRADLPAGQVHAFLHGEAAFVKQLRHHLRFERGVAKDALSVSGYWRLGRDDEGWRAEKARWKAEVEADEQAHAS